MASTGSALWPGTSTFPNTNVYPGQGDLPIVRCYHSTDDFSVSTPAYVDRTSKMRSWSISRGRQNELSDFDAGAASVVLDNRDRTFDPNINAAVRPKNRIWLFSEWSGEVHSLFRGYAESFAQAWDKSGIVDATTTISASDETRVLSGNVLPASGTVSGSNIGPIIGTVLDAVANGAPRRLQLGDLVPTGGFTLTYSAQSANSAVSAAAGSDIGLVANKDSPAFFIAADGGAVFLGAFHRAFAPYSVVQMTFDDDGTDSPYRDCQMDYSASFLYTQATLSGPSNSATASDAGAISQYGTIGYSRSVLNNDATDLAAEASALVNKFKNPFQRIVSIKPKMADAETARLVLNRDLMDRIEIFRTPPGGGARIDQISFIQRIEMSGSPGIPIDCTFGVSPL